MIFVTVIVLLVAAYCSYALLKPAPALVIKINPPSVPAAAKPYFPWPSYGESAFGAEGFGVLATHNTQSPVPMASTAKVVTALTVLQKMPITSGQQGPMITFGQQDVDFYNTYVAENGSVVRVVAGEQMSEYQALQAMLLPSANNIAESLAVWAYGSIGAYSAAANQLATQLGTTQTHIADASGFSPETTSTASDLVTIGLVALKNPILNEIVDQQSATLPGVGTVRNVNYLLGTNGIDGIKTGNTDQAGGVFLASASIPIGNKNVRVVSAIMNAPDLGTALHDSVPFAESARDAFENRTVVSAKQSLGNVTTAWGQHADVYVSNPLTVLRYKGSALHAQLIQNKASMSLPAGSTVGKLAITGAHTTYSSNIVTTQAITKPTVWWRLQHAF